MTMYLKTATDIAAAARSAKYAGYTTSQRDIRDNDRFVIALAARLATGQNSDVVYELERVIVEAVQEARREAHEFK